MGDLIKRDNINKRARITPLLACLLHHLPRLTLHRWHARISASRMARSLLRILRASSPLIAARHRTIT